MINPRLGNCHSCTTIPALISDIHCKIAKVAKLEYGNIIFDLNNRIDQTSATDLLNYKRILEYKYCNPEYAQGFTVEKIASRIKLLIHK
jgi:hypothetical protein